MRFYLDTNILTFLTGQDRGDSIGDDIQMLLNDYSVDILASAVCYQELVHLFQIGKLRRPQRGRLDGGASASEALDVLSQNGITLVPVTYKHIEELARLPLFDDHRDPNDRLIVAQAISDRVPLISSDRKFERYRPYGLDFMFNER